MSGPGSPGGEGPTQAPPHLPPGWIAQWDSNSKKYYYVQLSTGVSQWDVPTQAAPVGGTPASTTDHPFGVPGGQPELITHPDGTQTVKHADGRMEPVMPDESGNARAIGGDGPTGDRGFGSMAMNALLGGKQSGNSHGNSNNFSGLASQVLGGLTQSGGSGNHASSSSGGHNGSSGLGGKLVGQLASNLFSSGSKPQQSSPQNYHGGQTAQPSNSGGLAGSIMGSAAHLFGGQSHSSNQNYGYSNAGQQGTYSGSAPPASYQPSGMPTHQSPAQQPHTPQGAHVSQPPSYHTPASNPPQHSTPSYQTPTQGPQNPYGHQPQHTPSFPPPPPSQYEGGQHGYQGPPQHTQYGQHGQVPGPPPGQPPSHSQYGGHPSGPGSHFGAPQQGGAYGPQQHGPPAYGSQQGGYPSFQSPPSQYASQLPSYANQSPAVPHGTHPYGSNPQY